MSTPPTILLEDAGKRYIKYDDQPMIISSLLRLRAKTKRSHIWALRHIDLSAHSGECVGVIGRNGAGKTTMLQLLAGITSPTEGRAAVKGRVAPLIAVGVGFHPELTGRENVYINGAILGLNRAEIDRRLEEILDFSEIERFVDTPVKFYSSGMAVRLGFAVAIQSRPDVLLVDEVLAVGDLAFQWKCFDRMMEIRQTEGLTIAVVSHNLSAVRKLCDRTLLVNQGEIEFMGGTTDAIDRYHTLIHEKRDLDDPDNMGVGGVVAESWGLLAADGRPTAAVASGDVVTARAELRFDQALRQLPWYVSVSDAKGQNVYTKANLHQRIAEVGPGDRVAVECTFEVRLPTGSYRTVLGVKSEDLEDLLVQTDIHHFYVTGPPMVSGLNDLDAQIAIRSINETGESVQPAN